jgi:hypothetical protein
MKNIYKKISTALLLSVGLLASNANAQVSSYSFVQSSSTYVPIAGGTVVATATGNTTTTSLDDISYGGITIPFTFNFNGVAQTQMSINTNGYITFGAVVPSGTLYDPLSNTTSTSFNGIVSAWGVDINSVFNIGSKTGQISYKVLGVAPNRELVIQWSNFRPAYTSSVSDVYSHSFQIRLKETTNDIAVVYDAGSYLIGTIGYSSTDVQVGIRGNSPADFNSLTNPANVLFTSNTKAATVAQSKSYNTKVATPGMPTAGLTYTWSPGLPCTGTPMAGTLTTASLMVCPLTTYTVSVTGYTQGIGITTSWEKSTNGTTWTTASTTTPTLVNTAGLVTNDSIYYRVAVACNTGIPVYTNSIKLKANANFNQCYCVSEATSTADDDIGAFKFGNFINVQDTSTALNNASATNTYSNFTNLGPIVAQQAVTFPVTITQINSAGSYDCSVKIFIDYNHNGIYDLNENAYSGITTLISNAPRGNVLNGYVSIPANALVGITGLRIVLDEFNASPECGTYTFGETEDYFIDIQAGVACVGVPMPGTLTASNVLPCPATTTTVTHTGFTNGIGIKTEWEESANGLAPWTATGDTLNTLVNTGVTAGDSIYYRVKVTCTNGIPAYTNSIKIKANPNFSQCYCTASLGGGTSNAVNNFTIVGTTLNNTATGTTGNVSGNYSKFAPTGSATGSVNKAVSYTFNVTADIGSKISMWIDYDHSGQFDASEWTQIAVNSTNVLNSISVNIPSTAVTGPTGVRLRSTSSFGTNVAASACSNMFSGETEDYTLNIVAGAQCTGVINAGILSVLDSLPCPTKPTNIVLTGNTQALGIATAWETSTNGLSPWTATGDTTLSLLDGGLATPGDSIYYRVKVTCNGGTPTYTNIIKLKATTNFFDCYCSANLGGGNSNPIDNVTIQGTTLNNSATGTTSNVSLYYSKFPAIGTTTGSVSQASSYTLSVSTLSGGAIISAWIDYDHSGSFDPSEWTQVATNSLSGANAVTITIPITASTGKTGMRVRTRVSGATNGASSECANFASGETEDYIVNILPGTQCTGTPTAGILSVLDSLPCAGNTSLISLTGTTQAIGITTEWEESANGLNTWLATGDTSLTYQDGGLASPGDVIYYRVKVSCNGAAPVYTNIIKLKANTNFYACYCASSASIGADSDIGGFTFGQFSNNVSIAPVLNNNTAVNKYTNNNTLGPILAQRNVKTPFTVNQISSGTNGYPAEVKVYIDMNHNGSYDSLEFVYFGSITAVNGIGNVIADSIKIPITAMLGLTGLRVILKETASFGANPPIVPCNSINTYSYGETEDYIIKIDTVPVAPVAIAKKQTNVSVVLYPNPTMDVATIMLTGNSNNAVKCEVMNTLGQVIISNTVKQLTGSENITVNLANYVNGTYMVRVTSINNVTVKRLVVQH